MSEYIDREAVRRAIQEYCFSPKEITPAGIVKVVMNIPTADVVEVVRCRDCKHRNPYCDKCLRDNLWHDADDYCSYGERSENGTN